MDEIGAGAAFRRPLGLVLSGGGAHGAWQAGCLASLKEAGLEFDRVTGFSIGSITGVSYVLGLEELLSGMWREVDELRLMRLRPALQPSWRFPVTLFSHEPVRRVLGRHLLDESDNRRRARCELTVITHSLRDRVLEYPRFTPGGSGGWDGPLFDQVLASCAVPGVFPAVRMSHNGGSRLLVDGGLPAREPMHFDCLNGCSDVIALQMTRPDEVGRLGAWLKRGLDQLMRELCHRALLGGLTRLRRSPSPPRVYRLFPSRPLGYSQLRFSSKHCVPAFELGRRDGEAFLASPGPWNPESNR